MEGTGGRDGSTAGGMGVVCVPQLILGCCRSFTPGDFLLCNRGGLSLRLSELEEGLLPIQEECRFFTVCLSDELAERLSPLEEKRLFTDCLNFL